MMSKALYLGYNPDFISDNEVGLPILNSKQKKDLVKDSNGNSVIHYINYSLELSANHKFPYYTATNIDGKLFKKVARKDNWRKDKRINKEFQLGRELYGAPKSDFDRGHMTKREDVQWGKTPGIVRNAADSTFFYTNSVPQHKDLNQAIWRNLEDYILHTEAKSNDLRICVFTGPVLSNSNPLFVTPVKGKQIQIPVLFWKVVIYQKENGELFRVGFMMNQRELLLKHNIIEELESATIDEDVFLNFKKASTYQVNVSLIEELSELTFPDAIDSYTDSRSTELILDEIDIDPDLESDSLDYQLGFRIKNLVL